jgi:spermidine/putrescine-binding protein
MASSGAGPGSGPGPPWARGSVKKKEKWLVTRKTWRYMADAGKLLIPEALRKGKDMKEYTDDDISKLEDHFQKVCDQQQDFIEWEGPRQNPKTLLAGNRAPPQQGKTFD